MSDEYRPRIISLFAGCGGMDLGFHLEGYQTVWANDFDRWAVETYKANFGNIIKLGDITKIDPFTDESIPGCDLILGGFPCQDFSAVGARKGLDGARGGLFQNLVDFITAKKPKAFVAENVKGLLSANGGKAIEVILQAFDAIEPKYIVKPHLYNFAEYGVPQFRERVLFVGVRVDTGFRFIHPKPTHGPKGTLPYVTAGEALQGVENAKYNNEMPKMKPRTIEILNLIPEGGNYSSIPPEKNKYFTRYRFNNTYRRLHRNEPSRTIIAAGGGDTLGYHYTEARSLTNRERARIQSFPDDFIFIGTKAEVRRQIGNAVPPDGVHAVAKRLLPLFPGAYEPIDLMPEYEKLCAMTVKDRLKYITNEME